MHLRSQVVQHIHALPRPDILDFCKFSHPIILANSRHALPVRGAGDFQTIVVLLPVL